MPIRLVALCLALLAVLPLAAQTPATLAPGSDLDAFMARVLARRDDNWKKLQQYVLDEQETFLVTGPPAGMRYFGGRREYQWFPREGFFIRSPRRADGVAIDEQTRRHAEERWLMREQAREKRQAERNAKKDPGAAQSESAVSGDVGDLLRQSVEPAFVQSAYFLRFKFDQGHYALVGRERVLNRDVLRIEYYPSKLFDGSDDDRRGRRGGRQDGARSDRQRRDDAKGEQIQRQMNKVARVTLWVDPALHQILQYELHNVDMDFLPGRALVRMDELTASMRMAQPFPDVWLPDTIVIRIGMTTALGAFHARYDVQYSDYRLATATARIL